MNMQNIQILFFLLDNVIRLASWRMATEIMRRIGDSVGEKLARGLATAAVVGAILLALPPISLLGAVLPAGYPGGVEASQLRIGHPLLSHVLTGFFLGLMVWGGLWLCNHAQRAFMSQRSRFA